MELKPSKAGCEAARRCLLIVPYGIETNLHLDCVHRTDRLLIVPYGIETVQSLSETSANKLLIVPYGIETTQYLKKSPPPALLIVPYGIETMNG